MAKKSLEELIGQALDNIEHDRQVTEEMLNDLQAIQPEIGAANFAELEEDEIDQENTLAMQRIQQLQAE